MVQRRFLNIKHSTGCRFNRDASLFARAAGAAQCPDAALVLLELQQHLAAGALIPLEHQHRPFDVAGGHAVGEQPLRV